MHAATAFIIMEAADIMLPRLGLPDWTVTWIIILLIVGFPIAIIFSWIFDFTPEGVKKTEPIEEIKEQELPLPPVKRRLKVSDVIIVAFFVIVCILIYPKWMFK
jgi:adenylate cyclase